MFESCRAHSYAGAHVRGMVVRAAVGHNADRVLRHQSAAMRLDPNTHAFVLATAAITSLAFTIFALNLLALVLQHTLG